MARPGSFTAAVVTSAELNALGRVYTSGTRPTGADLYEGLEIYETDTDRRWMYTGAAWQFVGWATTAARPGVILTDAAQTLTTATSTDITWGTEVHDPDGWTSGASATLTVPAGWGGRYAITYTGVWQAAVSGNCGAAIYVNSAVAAASPSDVIYSGPTVSIVRTLAATDTIKVMAQHGSGSNKNIVSRLEIVWLGV